MPLNYATNCPDPWALRWECFGIFSLKILENSFISINYFSNCALKRRLTVTSLFFSLCTSEEQATNKLVFLSFAFIQVYELLPVKDLTGFPGSLNQHEEDDGDCIKSHNVFISGIMYSPVPNTSEKKIYSFLWVNLYFYKFCKIQVKKLVFYILKIFWRFWILKNNVILYVKKYLF